MQISIADTSNENHELTAELNDKLEKFRNAQELRLVEMNRTMMAIIENSKEFLPNQLHFDFTLDLIS